MTNEVTGEVLDDEPLGLERYRNPGVPATLNDLAALKGEALEVLNARIQILETARMHAIRMTHPEDWVLFKSPDGRVTAYLQDSGCERVRDILSIEVFNVTAPEKQTAADGKSFHYIVRGSGRSKITGQTSEGVEGGRQSTEDFCKGATGVELDLKVRKAARANLNGRIVRELAGLKNVPGPELEVGWKGTEKKLEHARKGRGFGSAEERLGATRAGQPDLDPPTCPHCQPPNTVKLLYRAGKDNRGAFYGCPNYTKHPDKKILVDAAKWAADNAKAATESGAPAPKGSTDAGE